MPAAPGTHYTRSADGTNLAYQLSGNGPTDLLILHGVYIPIDLLSEDPGFVRVQKRLDSFTRTAWFEGRGWGASEGDPRDSLSGEISDNDLIAVLDAAGFDRAALLADGVVGASAIHFAVAHPERVSALILLNSFAHYVREDDYPWGFASDLVDPFIARVKERWGTAESVGGVAPSRVADEHFRALFARAERFTGGPDLVADAVRISLERNVRSFLPSVSVPTLVLHRAGDRFIQLGAGRYLADHIPNAKFVVLTGDDHIFYAGDTDALVDEIEEFLTGARSGPEGEAVLAAVLFTDMVASTEHQARVGAREWSRLSDHHDAMARAALTRYKGHEVKTTGDGFLATFDATGRALRCAADILNGAKGIGLTLRAGVHIGEVEVRRDDLGGLAVTIAKRVCDMAEPGQVLVSEAVRSAMVGAGIAFDSHGVHELKGVPGTWPLYALATSP